jgi:hypothetical protein
MNIQAITKAEYTPEAKAVIEKARVAGVFDAYYAQNLTELRAALLRFHADCVLNDDRQGDANADKSL